MLNVRLACDHLFGKLLFTWLSLVMSMMVSFVLSFFPRDVLDEILNLIGSVSGDFPSYSYHTRSSHIVLLCSVFVPSFVQLSQRASELQTQTVGSTLGWCWWPDRQTDRCTMNGQRTGSLYCPMPEEDPTKTFHNGVSVLGKNWLLLRELGLSIKRCF